MFESLISTITASTPIFAGGFAVGLVALKRVGIYGMPGIFGALAIGATIAGVLGPVIGPSIIKVG